MKILHHIDADGHCSAAIIKNTSLDPFEPFNNDDLISYNYNGQVNFDYETLRKNEAVYIVDISLDDNIMEFIKNVYEKTLRRVVHIDHHASSITHYETRLSNEDKAFYDANVTSFINIDHSASLLCWVYSFMSETQKTDIKNVKFDFAEDYSCFVFLDKDGNRTSSSYPYTIPLALRYIDDYDIWKHQFPESKPFQFGYRYLEDNRPTNNELWNALLFNTTRLVADIIRDGNLIQGVKTKDYEILRKNGYEIDFVGYHGFVVNNPGGGSMLFGDLVNQYDFVGTYHFTKNKVWKYSMYSRDDSACDCGKVCKDYLNGGGHQHAAGGSLDKLVW